MENLVLKKIAHYTQNFENIIWDWNGTLIDDAWVAAKANSVLLENEGRSQISEQEYKEKFCYPIQDYYQVLGFDLEKTDFHKIGDQFIELYQDIVKEATLFSGMEELLSFKKQNGYTQSILSAATEKSILELLTVYGIRGYFDFVYGLDNHYDINKLKRGEQLIEEAGFNPKKTLLIGDTDHDKEVADHLGIELLLVADGHQNFERLSKLHDQVLESRF